MVDFADKWAAKIAKLMAMADDPNIGVEERDAFLSKANQLMREYKIEWAKIQEAQGRRFQDVDKLETVWGPAWPKGEDAAWRRTVFGAIAELMFCKALIAVGRDNDGRCVIIGTKHDLEIALNVFDRVIAWLERDCMKAYIIANMKGEIKHAGRVNAYNWRMAFKSAAALAIVQRVGEMLDDRDNDPETRAIVVVNKNEIERYINENYNIHKSDENIDDLARRLNNDLGEANRLGYESGRRVPLTNELREGNDGGQPGENA